MYLATGYKFSSNLSYIFTTEQVSMTAGFVKLSHLKCQVWVTSIGCESSVWTLENFISSVEGMRQRVYWSKRVIIDYG